MKKISARETRFGALAKRSLWKPGVAAALLLLGGLMPGRLSGHPEGMTVVSGTATATRTGTQLEVQVSHRAFLDWASFNIGANETTTFVQPSVASIVINRINDANPSQIFGRLQANGMVVLASSAGFYFGPNSVIQAGGLVVTTTPVLPSDFASGGLWQFTGPPPLASIVNFGELKVAPGGSLFLIAHLIDNHGTLSAPDGSIGLYAGKEVLVSERPDGRGLSATVRLPEGSVDNSGKLVAEAGAIFAHAQVINQDGLVRANAAEEHNGVIELFATEAVNLGSHSRLEAQAQGPAGQGGEIRVRSGSLFTDQPGSSISVAGGAAGGTGGKVEISAPRMSSLATRLEGGAAAGSRGGQLVLDPTDILLSSSGSGSAAGGQVGAGELPETLKLDVSSAFIGFSEIRLEATRDILLERGIQWQPDQSTGNSEASSKLTLAAGRDIVIREDSSIKGGSNWSLELLAGYDFGQHRVRAGQGSVRLEGKGSLETRNGQLTVTAGQDVKVQGGFIHTLDGGSIQVEAVAGNVDSGSNPAAFSFTSGGSGYSVGTGAGLGGISTAHGGGVSIKAGGDVYSYLPALAGSHQDGGSGAFGPEPGNVAVQAGGSVYGHFVVANGTGEITAGKDIGHPARQVALSLVKGSWELDAPDGSIYLQEVRNPNGIFNNQGIGSAPASKHRFDYDPAAAVSLAAGVGVQLLGGALPRAKGEDGLGIFYPPTLAIDAGAGGVLMGNNLTLMPSPQGNLDITTHNGGNFGTITPGTTATLTMSDSGKNRYTKAGDFGLTDHADQPVHLNDSQPVKLDLSGSIENIHLQLPKKAEIRIAKDMKNTSFEGQNLGPHDHTTISVAGDIINRNDFTFVSLQADPLTLADGRAVFDEAVDPAYPLPSISSLQQRLVYSAGKQQLGFLGRMTANDLKVLSALPLRTYDQNGLPLTDADGLFVTHPVPLIDPGLLRQLYNDSQNVPSQAPAGIQIGGPGELNITARNLDLGFCQGIISGGPMFNPALSYAASGARMTMELEGNLAMFSSSIQSLYGGDIQVTAKGSVDVGSQETLGKASTPRGIYTVGQSSLSIVAGGDIDVNGSRIASYGGGDITVKSLEGNVNAGSGGIGFVRVTSVSVDPATRQVATSTQPIPGSGIIAATLPDSTGPVGDILVEARHGNINASAGGVVQMSFNENKDLSGMVTLVAGERDAQGRVTREGNIDASNSGVIGQNVKLEASGSVLGLVVAKHNIDIQAQQNVNVTAMAQGSISVSAGGNASGTMVSLGGIQASASSIDAAMMSKDVSASGDASAAKVGFSQAAAAGATSQSAQPRDNPAAAKPSPNTEEEDSSKNKRAKPQLARTIGRVTIILPVQ